jgi:hypothetical protein
VVGGEIAAINQTEDLYVKVHEEARNHVPDSSVNHCRKIGDASQQP